MDIKGERLPFRIVKLLYGTQTIHDFREMVVRHGALRLIVGHTVRATIPTEVTHNPALFIHIPKNGGVSIARALYGRDVWHRTAMLYATLAPEFRNKPESFAILRDPTQRFLSTYDFFRHGGGAEAGVLPPHARALANMKSPDVLLDYIEGANGDWLKIDAPARPQWWFIVDEQRRIFVRQLLTYRRDTAILESLVTRFGVAPLQHLNRTRREPQFLDDAQLQRLRRIYAIDYDLYDYIMAHEPGVAVQDRSIDALTMDIARQPLPHAA